MNSRAYYLQLLESIHNAPHVISSNLHFEEIDSSECYIRGVITLIGNYELHIAEYVETEPTLLRPKYRYHLQSPKGDLISRWDNAPHHPTVATFPNHLHNWADSIFPSSPMDVASVLSAALQLIETPERPEPPSPHRRATAP